MKKFIAFCAAIALLASCGDNKSTQPKGNGMPKASDATATTNVRIAYIEVDSLMTQLDMCKEGVARLEAQTKASRQQLDAKTAAFQKAYQEFAQKMQTTGYASQSDYEAAQKRLQKMQEEGQRLEMQLTQKMQTEQEKFNAVLRDSVRAYINIINADGKYSMIISKSGDNVLYADPSLDITEEVIKGMNKRYKK